jgi:hypothetical protein
MSMFFINWDPLTLITTIGIFRQTHLSYQIYIVLLIYKLMINMISSYIVHLLVLRY